MPDEDKSDTPATTEQVIEYVEASIDDAVSEDSTDPAIRDITDALRGLLELAKREKINRRRSELIWHRYHHGELNAAEADELNKLQALMESYEPDIKSKVTTKDLEYLRSKLEY